MKHLCQLIMAQPKKDAFADLFQTASGSSRKANNATMKDQLKQPMASTPQNSSWSNLGVLSPNVSSNVSRRLTPLVATNSPSQLGKSSSEDPFAIFDLQQSLPKSTVPKQASPTPRNSQAPQTMQQTQNDLLLDDEFTDAFVQEQKEAPAVPQTQTEEPHTQGNDDLLAELVDIGFSIDDANEAIECAGPDLQDCVNYIMSKNTRRTNAPIDRQRQQPRGDINASINDVSNKLYSTASWFLDKSKKKLINGISTLQQQHLNNQTNDGRPAWMKTQHMFKDGALERQNGGTAEDYGTDEDNINSEEIQRIIAMQKERERERQKERFLERGSQPSLGQSLPRKGRFDTPDLPLRPRSTLSSTEQRSQVRQQSPKLVSRPSSSQSGVSRTPSLQSQVSQTPSSHNGHESTAAAPNTESVDLLGLQTDAQSPAQRFRSGAGGDSDSIPTRRRQTTRTPTSSSRLASNVALNAFQQSDYETAKDKGAQSFSRGDFHDALEAYTKCLSAIPEKHELRIVITANIALTAIKLGDYRLAKEKCDEGINLVGESVGDQSWYINEKGIKYWYTKLLMRKAESMELMEQFPEALECYMLLISKHGVTDLKIMEAKRRISKIVNPPKLQPRAPPQSNSAASLSRPVQSEKVERIKQQHAKEKREEELKFQLHDQVHERTAQWSQGKETNIRALLTSLSDVLPQRLGFAFITNKPITMNDLMLTKKVKINYMKVISSIHPDKLEHFGVEDKMICQLVFVTLNKAWDEFKVQNQIA